MCRRAPFRPLRGTLARLLAATASVALTAAATAGCGAATVAERSHRVSLTLQEYRILPQSISVPPGKIVLVARNRGILVHSVAVELGHLEEGTPEILGATGAIMPGASATLTITLRRPGRYLLASTVANQRDLGMNGTLIVR